jgi:centrin-3
MSNFLKYKPQISNESLESVQKAFKLFQDDNGALKCDDLMFALQELKFDQQEPVIFDIIEEICSTNKVGLTYDKFVEKLNEQLQDRGSQKSTERTYGLFVEDSQSNLTLDSLKRVAREVGDNASEEEIKKIFNYASNNGQDIPYEDFHSIMTRSYMNN